MGFYLDSERSSSAIEQVACGPQEGPCGPQEGPCGPHDRDACGAQAYPCGPQGERSISAMTIPDLLL